MRSPVVMMTKATFNRIIASHLKKTREFTQCEVTVSFSFVFDLIIKGMLLDVYLEYKGTCSCRTEKKDQKSTTKNEATK
jgi:glycine betaine/choline ABC-type transport system substrate-binding protein